MKVIGFQSQTLIFLFLLHFLLLHFLLTCATVYYSGYHSNLILLPARLLAARQSFSTPIFRNVVLVARSLPTEHKHSAEVLVTERRAGLIYSVFHPANNALRAAGVPV